MKIVISGGTGLIGTALARALLEKEQTVTILSRQAQYLPHPTSANYVHWDAIHSDPWVSVLEDCDVVINLAGKSIGGGRWNDQRKSLIETSRVYAGKLLVDTIRKSNHKPSYFIQASAIGYYGTSLTELFEENSPVGTDYLAQTAQKWEDSSREVEELGVARAVIRTGVVLDPYAGVLPKMLLPFKLFVGGPLGSGKQWLSWIHLADEVAAIMFLIDHKLPGVFNLTSPNAATNSDFGKSISSIIKRPYWLPAPEPILSAVLGEMSTLVLDGQRVYPRHLLEMGFQFQFPTLIPALMNLLKPKLDV